MLKKKEKRELIKAEKEKIKHEKEEARKNKLAKDRECKNEGIQNQQDA